MGSSSSAEPGQQTTNHRSPISERDDQPITDYSKSSRPEFSSVCRRRELSSAPLLRLASTTLQSRVREVRENVFFSWVSFFDALLWPGNLFQKNWFVDHQHFDVSKKRSVFLWPQMALVYRCHSSSSSELWKYMNVLSLLLCTDAPKSSRHATFWLWIEKMW